MSLGADISPWYERARVRVRAALGDRHAIGDRGAMLRELCRLHGGYLALPTEDPLVTADDLAHLTRFGLRRVPSDGGFALIIDDPNPRVPGLAEAGRLDPDLRQDYPPACADAVLLDHSAFAHYRAPSQKAAVRALATMPAGATLLATLPTGAGKSLLFQLAPSLAEDACACVVVIVPTVALALAHRDALRKIAGLAASECIYGDQTAERRRQIFDAFGRGEVPILILSPEIALAAAHDLLLEAATPSDAKLPSLRAHLTHLVVDEAHIIESWGRTFRPDFQRLRGLVASLRAANPALRTVLLSATVNDAAKNELVRAFGSEPFLAIEAKVNRYEFDFLHHEMETAAARDATLLATLDVIPRPAIVYTTLVRHAEALHRALQARGYERLAVFTGQLDDTVGRLQVVEDWREGRIDLVVATSAFGMGIDKDDVRAVVHACAPESPSRYFQEIGRAARDGAQALALMLWTDGRGGSGDWRQARRLWSGSWLRPQMLRKRWGALLGAAQDLGQIERTGAILRIGAPLDAFHDGLPHGDTDYNQDWNRSLLNLLQRGGAVTVVATETTCDRPIWWIDIHEPRLLVANGDDVFWAAISDLRRTERDAALADLDRFQEVVRQPNACVSASLFALIEAGGPLVPPCGRCAFCRAEHIEPPTAQQIRFGGLDRVWRVGQSRGGVTVVHPQDADTISDDLLTGLVGQGVEQFIVDAHETDELARRLSGRGCRYGFVSSHADILRDWCPAKLKTAIVLRAKDPVQRIWERLAAWRSAAGEPPLWVVAADDLRLQGRPVAQAISNRAPIGETALRRALRDPAIP